MKHYLIYFCFFYFYIISCSAQEIASENTKFGVIAYEFGAIPNDKKDDTEALEKALAYCHQHKKNLYLPAGEYEISKTLVKPESFYCPSIIGENNATTIKYSGIRDAPVLKIIGGSGALCNAVIQGIRFAGNETTTAIEILGQGGLTIIDCSFAKNKLGVLFHNQATNSFTEYDVIDRCVFDASCTVAYEYKRTNGTESFNGTGAKEIRVNSSYDYAIKIGPGCIVYNAPLDGQFWTHKEGQSVIKHEGSTRSNVYGDLTIESAVKDVTLVPLTDVSLLYVGNIAALTKTKLGNLIEAYNVNVTGPEDKNMVYVGLKPRRLNVKLKKGENKINNFGSKANYFGESMLVDIVVRTDFYENRALLAINHNGYGQKGTVTNLNKGFETNAKGYSSMPGYSLDNNGTLVITIPKDVPDGNLNATVNFIPLSSGLSVN